MDTGIICAVISAIGLIIAAIVKLFAKGEHKNMTQNVTILSDGYKSDKQAELSIENYKLHSQILFIDDDPEFGVVKILKNSGWNNVEYRNKVSDYDDKFIKKADVIFVDVHGVGTLIYKNEGIGLAANIKKHYPNKKVVIYSSEQNGDLFDKDLHTVDRWLKKDAEPYQFIATLEDLLCEKK